MHKIKKETSFFYIAYLLNMAALFVVDVAFSSSRQWKLVLTAITVVVLLISILINGVVIELSSLPKLFIVGVVTIYSIIFRDYFMLLLLLFMFAYDQEINDKYMFRIGFLLAVIGIGSVLLLCALGIIENETTYRLWWLEEQGDVRYARYALGFTHSDILPTNLVYVFVFYVMYKDDLRFRNMIVFQAFAIIVYIICDSRNGLISMEIALVLLVLIKLFQKKLYTEKIIVIIANFIRAVYVAMFFLSIGLIYLYRANFFLVVKLNDLISNRIFAADEYFSIHSLKILNLSSYDNFIKTLIRPLDNGYYYILARYGILYMLLFLGVIFWITKKMIESKNINGLAILFVVALLNFIDNDFFSWGFYPFLIYGMGMMWNYKKKKRQTGIKLWKRDN